MNWLKNHSAKVIGFLTALQAILDSLGDSPITTALGPHGGKIVILAGSVVTALLTFLAPGKPITAPSAPTITTAAKVILIGAALTTLAAGLPGCATLTNLIDNPSVQQVLIQDGTELALAALLQAIAPGQRGQDATALVTGCSALEAVGSASSTTASAAGATLTADIQADTKLTALQAQLLGSMVTNLNAVVTGLAADNKIAGTEVLSVTTVCGWVIAVAAPLQGP